MSTVELVAIAAASMVVVDIVYTIEVQCEASGRASLAGLMDVIGWFTSIATTTISVTVLQEPGWGLRKLAVLVFVGGANFVGTYAGTRIGKWLLRKRGVTATPGDVAPRKATRDLGLKP